MNLEAIVFYSPNFLIVLFLLFLLSHCWIRVRWMNHVAEKNWKLFEILISKILHSFNQWLFIGGLRMMRAILSESLLNKHVHDMWWLLVNENNTVKMQGGICNEITKIRKDLCRGPKMGYIDITCPKHTKGG